MLHAGDQPKFVPQPVPAEDAAKIAQLLSECRLEKPKARRRVLVFWRCEGFAHGKAIEYANAAYQAAAEKTGAFSVDFTADYAALKAENLARYDVLVMNNTTGLRTKENPWIEDALIGFVRDGKGYVALHGGADNFGDAPALCALLGGLFDGHPWGSGGTWQFKVDDPASPVTAPLGATPFKWSDEIYQHKPLFCDRAKLHVLVSLDLSDPATAASNAAKQNNPETKDYPVSWIRPYGKGRVFYTSFGHDQRAYLDRRFLNHILLGTQYAAGDVGANDLPPGISDAQLKKLSQAEPNTEAAVWTWITDLLTTTHPISVRNENVRKIAALLRGQITPAARAGIERALIPYRRPKAEYAPLPIVKSPLQNSGAEPPLPPANLSKEEASALFAKYCSDDKPAGFALAATGDPAVDGYLFEFSAGDPAKTAKALELYLDRRGRRAIPKILGYTAAANDAKVREAAWRSLRKVVDETDLDPLLKSLAGAADVNPAEQTLLAALKPLAPEARNAVILKAWKAASDDISKAVLFSLMQRYNEAEFVPELAALVRSGGKMADDAARTLAKYKGVDDAVLKVLLAYASTDRRIQIVGNNLYATLGIDLFGLLANNFADPAAKKMYLAVYEKNLAGAAAVPSVELGTSKWKAEASHGNNDVGRAFDRNPDSRWASNAGSVKGMWFQLDLGERVYVTEVVQDTEKSPNDTPNGCELTVSEDGKTWSGVVSASDGAAKGKVVLPVNRSARCIRLTATGARPGLFWSIHELFVKTGIPESELAKIRQTAQGLKQ